MPTDEQIKLEIAKLKGWTYGNRASVKKCTTGLHGHWHDRNSNCQGAHLPNWPTDRNASYELAKDVIFLRSKPHTAYEESMAWILNEGYRWVECAEDECYKGQWRAGECPACSGEKGEWRKV